MKSKMPQKLAVYIYNNFLGNFLGFIVGMASTGIASHFFSTRSIKNLWGLTTKKTLVDKQTFSILEWSISIFIGFVVFEIISKSVKKKMDELMPAWKEAAKTWIGKNLLPDHSAKTYTDQDTGTIRARSNRIHRDVQ
jgi:hypothetical protein